MNKVSELITNLEKNKLPLEALTHTLESLTTDETICLLLHPLTKSELEKTSTNDSLNDEYLHKRASFFQSNITTIKDKLSTLTLKELMKLLKEIPSSLIDLKNEILEYILLTMKVSTKPIDKNKINKIFDSYYQGDISEEDIVKTILYLSKEEFTYLICSFTKSLTNNSNSSTDKSKKNGYFIRNHTDVIASKIEEYSSEDIAKVLPLISNDFYEIKQMLFNCLTEEDALNLFIDNPNSYFEEIYHYLVSPGPSSKKDKIIIKILSDSRLYKEYSEKELLDLKSNLSNKEIILHESYNLVGVTEKDTINAAAGFIANLKARDNLSIKRGILKKLSSKKLYNLLNEVNKGLLNIEEDKISIEEFIFLMAIPLDKAVLFLNECESINEEEKMTILNTIYPKNPYRNENIKFLSDYILKYQLIDVLENKLDEETFPYCYRDILELEYNQDFFLQVLEDYIERKFYKIPNECMNIFLAQLIAREKKKWNLDFEVDFYTGKSATQKTVTNTNLGSYDSLNNLLSININAYKELSSDYEEYSSGDLAFNLSISFLLLETVFHELRHAYQNKALKGISNLRDLYFVFDQILHQEQYFQGMLYYSKNYKNDSREVDAELYGKIATALLIRKDSFLRGVYWKMNGERIKELTKKENHLS